MTAELAPPARPRGPAPAGSNMAIDQALLAARRAGRALAPAVPLVARTVSPSADTSPRLRRYDRAADRGAGPRRGAAADRRPGGVARRGAHLRGGGAGRARSAVCARPTPRSTGMLLDALRSLGVSAGARAPARRHRARRGRLLRLARRRRDHCSPGGRWSAAPSSEKEPRCSSMAPCCSPAVSPPCRMSPSALRHRISRWRWPTSPAARRIPARWRRPWRAPHRSGGAASGSAKRPTARS